MQFFKDASPLNKLFFPCKPPGYGQVALQATANAAAPSSPPSTSASSSSARSSRASTAQASAAAADSKAAASSKPHVAISSDPIMSNMVFLGPRGDPCLHREFGRWHRASPARQMPTRQTPARRKSGQRRCVIYFHGNFMDLGDISYTEMPGVCTHLEATLLVPEYPGYGLALGSASEGSCMHVAQQVVDYAVCNLGFRHNEIILVGRSIGSGVALQSCAHITKHYGPPLAVVLQSGFTSLRDVARDITPLGSVLSTRFPNQEMIDDLGITNLLLVHGGNDTLIPPRHSQALYDAASSVSNRVIKVWPSATHNSFPGAAATHMAGFLERCSPPPERLKRNPGHQRDGSETCRPSTASWLQSVGRTFTGCVPLAVREYPCSPSAYRQIPGSRLGDADAANSDDEAQHTVADATTARVTSASAQCGPAAVHRGKQGEEHVHRAGTSPVTADEPTQQEQQQQQLGRFVEVQNLSVEEMARRYERQVKRTEDFERSIARWSRFLGYFLPTAPQ